MATKCGEDQLILHNLLGQNSPKMPTYTHWYQISQGMGDSQGGIACGTPVREVLKGVFGGQELWG